LKVADILLFIFVVLDAAAQSPSKNILRLTVMVRGLNGAVPGTGVVFGDDAEHVYIVTAAHVVGKEGGPVLVTLHPDFASKALSDCSVGASTASSPMRSTG